MTEECQDRLSEIPIGYTIFTHSLKTDISNEKNSQPYKADLQAWDRQWRSRELSWTFSQFNHYQRAINRYQALGSVITVHKEKKYEEIAQHTQSQSNMLCLRQCCEELAKHDYENAFSFHCLCEKAFGRIVCFFCSSLRCSCINMSLRVSSSSLCSNCLDKQLHRPSYHILHLKSYNTRTFRTPISNLEV